MEQTAKTGQSGRRRTRNRKVKKKRPSNSGASKSSRGGRSRQAKKSDFGIKLPTQDKGIIQVKANVAESSDAAKGKVKKRKYAVQFFETFQAAYSAEESIKTACSHCDQLNVVVKAEGSMDDEQLLGMNPKVKVFAGEAWHLIHTRRVEDEWYEELQE